MALISKWILGFALLALNSSASPIQSSDLFGRWIYVGFIYDGHRYERPNPDLYLYFTFDEHGTHRLFWRRKGERRFCERVGSYEVRDNRLRIKVTWVNPENDSSCHEDPDMQLGRETENLISLSDQDLGIYMNLNGKEFIYLLRKLSLEPEN